MKRKSSKLQLAMLVLLIFGIAFCLNQAFWSDLAIVTRVIFAVAGILFYGLILLLPFISMRHKGKQISLREYVLELVRSTLTE